MPKQIPDCKRFSGYKPCFPDHDCWTEGCKDNIPTGTKILIINLDAMGDVLMTTAQLPAIKKKYPESTIYWVTLNIAVPLLYHNEYIDQVFSYDAESILILSQMEFDLVMNVDKSQRSGALLNAVNAKQKLGFGINKNGKIIPVNKGAYYNYQLGMDDHLKFKENQIVRQQYLADTFELEYHSHDYVFNFSDEEKEFISKYKTEIGISDTDKVVGFNTGCSTLYPE